MPEIFTVVNIYRIYEKNLSFIIALHNKDTEYFRIDKSLSERVSKGMVFIGDRAVISKITSDGIIFDVLKENDSKIANINPIFENEIDFYYSGIQKKILPTHNPKLHYLPYLCDVLPYNTNSIPEAKALPIFKNNIFQGKYIVGDQEVSNIKLPLPGMFIAKIHQKTRINTYPISFNPFFFIIASSNNIFIKIVFWMEHLRDFSNLKVGDVIMIKDYRIKKKWAVIDKVDFNTFTESIYFDCDEISAKELIKITVDKKGTEKTIFETVEGSVEYMSILMRYNCNDSLMEYVLMKIGGKNVLLFYNSDAEFYNIRTRNRIQIKELRKVNRAGFELYISTIYTQFELRDDSDEFQAKKPKENEIYIFGAMGYLPDNFANLSEILEYSDKDTIHGQEVCFNLFMRPQMILVEDLRKQSLLLNEVKKFLVNSSITEILDIECTVDYAENEISTKQGSFSILLEGQTECFVYENFFDKKSYNFGVAISKKDFIKLISKRMYFVIEGFRADECAMLYYLTGLFDE